jgi:hypothetical protein
MLRSRMLGVPYWIPVLSAIGSYLSVVCRPQALAPPAIPSGHGKAGSPRNPVNLRAPRLTQGAARRRRFPQRPHPRRCLAGPSRSRPDALSNHTSPSLLSPSTIAAALSRGGGSRAPLAQGRRRQPPSLTPRGPAIL